MARKSDNRIQSAPIRRRAPNPLIPLLIVIIVIIGLLFFFSHSAKLGPVHPIEVDVARASEAH